MSPLGRGGAQGSETERLLSSRQVDGDCRAPLFLVLPPLPPRLSTVPPSPPRRLPKSFRAAKMPSRNPSIFSSSGPFFFWPHHAACRISVPRPGIEPGATAGKMPTPNHWTARKFPLLLSFHPREMKTCVHTKNLCTNVHSCISHNRQKAETTQMSSS